MKHGQGTGREAGETYTGAWRDDLANGMGVLTRSNGEVLEGEFVDDEFVGDE
jgi:hypothetical protein